MTLKWSLLATLFIGVSCVPPPEVIPTHCDPECEAPLFCDESVGECVAFLCGNGVVEDAEACDAGPENSNKTPNACRLDCTLAGCGDAVVDQGEACDDGNQLNDDYCSAACDVDFGHCGDGTLSVEAGETCDDGNTLNGDYCSSNCAQSLGHFCFLVMM